MVIDCSHPPQETPRRNHNDLNLVFALQEKIQAKKVILTHISHDFDCWLMQFGSRLPSNYLVAQDGLSFEL
jgi:phosphoribosyl 1,2-cyclic phosphate phosphodiesterase